jgi:indole-3-glycerol phosphate synthase
VSNCSLHSVFHSISSPFLTQALSEAGLEKRVPITGFFSAASFCSEPAAIMKTDSVYALLTSKTLSSGSPDAAFPSSTSATSTILVDVLTDTERQMYDDFQGEFSGVIVRKRDPEAAPPVRVASMDYLVPEKQPNPSNFLESLVWDREKDVNRMREALQLARAISQAKLAGVRFPQRSLATAVHNMKTKLSLLSAGDSAGRQVPPVLVEIMRSSVNYGRALDSASPAFLQSALKGLQSIPSVVSVGCHVDLKNFGGQFQDVEALRTTTPETLPVFCNDFILYGYQIFSAKAAGADVIKLMSAILTSQEVTYFIKIAKTLGMSCVVVVASKVQALDVLANVAGLEAMSVTSRNMRIWKTDPGKAERILGDSEVQAAIVAKQLEQPFLLMQEGFSSPEEVLRAGQNGVDAVFLSEELLVDQKPIVDAVNSWIGL